MLSVALLLSDTYKQSIVQISRYSDPLVRAFFTNLWNQCGPINVGIRVTSIAMLADAQSVSVSYTRICGLTTDDVVQHTHTHTHAQTGMLSLVVEMHVRRPSDT